MSLETQPADVLRFGTFEADLRSGELRKQGKRIRLQEQPFQVLAILLQRPGDVVTREELRSRMWRKDTFVDFDNSLNTAINKLREALGDSADSPRFIETLPRRGYRFIAPVSGAQAEDFRKLAAHVHLRPLGWAAGIVSFVVLAAMLFSLNLFRVRDRLLGGSRVPQIQSLAVLPLTNLSGDPNQEYFSDGMTDALITDLAQMGSVKVISRTSVMRYKKTDKALPQIARELNVDAIVEGTVQRSGDRVRITAQLIHGLSDRHVWANTYERDLRDVLALQDEVARTIVREINLNVTRQDQTRQGTVHAVNPQAYEAYLRGLVYSRHDGVDSKRTSVGYFDRAIQIDPQWAEPQAQLARSYDWIAGTGGHPEFYPKAKAAALDAIRMDESLAEAHTALAFSLFNYDWDWAGAAREYLRALQLNHNYSEAHHAYAELLMASGRDGEAVTEIKRAQELDPLLPALRVNVGMVYSCVGQHDAAIEQLRNTTELNPDYDLGYSGLGIAYLRKAMYPEAIANLEKALDMDKDDPDVILDVVDLAYAYAAAGRKNEARKMLNELERAEASGRKFGSQGLYPIYFALGEKERGLEWLEKAYREKSESLLYLRCWPEFDRELADPRFADVVRRVGIPQ
jgi:TolB-like protein/DNA-binding winged helix-turn-helix (wHTH) protein/tetratricopeptide (TPR) repeat protein